MAKPSGDRWSKRCHPRVPPFLRRMHVLPDACLSSAFPSPVLLPFPSTHVLDEAAYTRIPLPHRSPLLPPALRRTHAGRIASFWCGTGRARAMWTRRHTNPPHYPSPPPFPTCAHRPHRIILVRHGQSEGNVDEAAYTRIPDSKIALTKKVLITRASYMI
ncbi:unnamed protein product [Closterium sp. NIES-54]